MAASLISSILGYQTPEPVFYTSADLSPICRAVVAAAIKAGWEEKKKGNFYILGCGDVVHVDPRALSEIAPYLECRKCKGVLESIEESLEAIFFPKWLEWALAKKEEGLSAQISSVIKRPSIDARIKRLAQKIMKAATQEKTPLSGVLPNEGVSSAKDIWEVISGVSSKILSPKNGESPDSKTSKKE